MPASRQSSRHRSSRGTERWWYLLQSRRPSSSFRTPTVVPDTVLVEEPQAASATAAPTNQSPRFMDASCRSRLRTRTTGQTGARTTLPRGFSVHRAARRPGSAIGRESEGFTVAGQRRDHTGLRSPSGCADSKALLVLEQPVGADLETQQKALTVETTAVAGERAVGADDPVARDDDRDRVAAVRETDRP